MSRTTKVLTILIIISAICNIYATCYILGKGIVVNNYTTNHQEQYQQQWQGQLLLNQWTAQGDKLEWHTTTIRVDEKFDNDTVNNMINVYLNSLHPISSLYAKVSFVRYRGSVFITYPDIFTKTKEVVK